MISTIEKYAFIDAYNEVFRELFGITKTASSAQRRAETRQIAERLALRASPDPAIRSLQESAREIAESRISELRAQGIRPSPAQIGEIRREAVALAEREAVIGQRVYDIQSNSRNATGRAVSRQAAQQQALAEYASGRLGGLTATGTEISVNRAGDIARRGSLSYMAAPEVPTSFVRQELADSMARQRAADISRQAQVVRQNPGDASAAQRLQALREDASALRRNARIAIDPLFAESMSPATEPRGLSRDGRRLTALSDLTPEDRRTYRQALLDRRAQRQALTDNRSVLSQAGSANTRPTQQRPLPTLTQTTAAQPSALPASPPARNTTLATGAPDMSPRSFQQAPRAGGAEQGARIGTLTTLPGNKPALKSTPMPAPRARGTLTQGTSEFSRAPTVDLRNSVTSVKPTPPSTPKSNTKTLQSAFRFVAGRGKKL